MASEGTKTAHTQKLKWKKNHINETKYFKNKLKMSLKKVGGEGIEHKHDKVQRGLLGLDTSEGVTERWGEKQS